MKTFGTNHGVTNEQLERMILSGKVFDSRPYALIRDLGLMRSKGWSYRDTAAYGHFGRDIFPWEKTDRTAAKLKAVDRAGEERIGEAEL